VASPFDAATHDAFGKLHGRNCYHTYGPDLLAHDLGHYLGPEFHGDRLDTFISREPAPRLPLYHLVGALDPLTPADVTRPRGGAPPPGRRHARAAGRLDGGGRPDAPDDQAQRRRPGLGRGPGARRRARRRRDAAPPRRAPLVLLAGLQRALPERGLPAGP